jgi:Spy/CpxP family protein refolding chaperone
VNPWKLILATLAIFVTGLVTGVVLVEHLAVKPVATRPPSPAPATDLSLQPGWLREEFVRRMDQELNLTPEQRRKVMNIVHESQERAKLLYTLIGDDVREEMRQTQEAIRKEITPEQAQKFEEMLKRRPRFSRSLRPDVQVQGTRSFAGQSNFGTSK